MATMEETLSDPTLSKHSQGDSWADLPDSEPISDLPEARPEPPDKKPGEVNLCKACGEEIVREPGKRGRAPKFHPDCRPSGATAAVRTKRVGNAQAEADEIVSMFRSAYTKLAIMVAAADKYDAFVMMVNLKGLSDNLRSTLIRYPNIRKQLLDVKGAGSLFGFVLTLLMTILPILAHHGLVPFKTLAPVLVNAPKSLFAIQQQLENGEANLTKVMQEQMSAMTKARKAGDSAK